MKKSYMVFAVLAFATLLGLGLAKFVFAANQFNWGTSTGGAWGTPDDTATVKNQVLQIGNGSQTVVASSSPTFVGSVAINNNVSGIPGLTITQINSLTPSTTGQLIFCNNCTVSMLCISSGTLSSQWIIVGSSAPLNTLAPCK